MTPMPRNNPLRHLPISEWPAADRLLGQRAAGRDDPFADEAGARLAPSTRRSYMFGWRRFLGFLLIHEPAALDITPAERLTIERVRAFSVHLAQTCTPRSVAKGVDTLFLAARMLMPEKDWAWLRTLKGRLYAVAPARTAAGPVITSAQLLELGEKLMEASRPDPGRPISRRDAIRFRDGFLFAFLAFIPGPRRKNVAALEIGRHLVKKGDNWFVIIPREETKTGAPIDCQVPALLESYLAVYLSTIRPRLLRGRTSTALWLSSWGSALSYSMIGQIFSQHSMSYFGFRIAPHDARDAAMTAWAIAAPDRITIARDLLTHHDLRTGIKHYNRARGVEASRAHAQLIAAMRRKGYRRRTG
jgi:hypothetical protein